MRPRNVLVSNTSKAEQGLFTTKTDKNGKTTLVLTDAAKSFKGEHTVAYNRLAGAIASKNVGFVGIHDTYTLNGKTFNTPVPGLTLGPAPGQAGNFRTMLSTNGFGGGNMSVIPGTTVPAPMNIIAAHEVMGHGYEILTGGDLGQVARYQAARTAKTNMDGTRSRRTPHLRATEAFPDERVQPRVGLDIEIESK